jgi:hypothetical protein
LKKDLDIINLILTNIQSNNKILAINENKILAINENKILAINENKIPFDVSFIDAIPFKYIDKKLRDSRDFILEIIQKNGNILNYLSDTMKNDTDIVKLAVSNTGNALKYANIRFKSDRNIVKQAIETFGFALILANKIFQQDIQLVNAAISQNPVIYYYLNKKAKMVESTIRHFMSKVTKCNIIKMIPDILLTNREFVLDLAKKDINIVKYLSDEFKSDKEIILNAMKINGKYLNLINDTLKSDKDIIFAALQNGCSFKFINPILQQDFDTINHYLENNENILKYLNNKNKIKNNLELLIKAIKNEPDSIKYEDFHLNKSCVNRSNLISFLNKQKIDKLDNLDKLDKILIDQPDKILVEQSNKILINNFNLLKSKKK